MKKDQQYVSREDCVRRGFVRKNGGIYKMSVLERFAEKGWLDFGDSKYSAQDRLKAAEKLQKDYEQSYFMSMSAGGIRERIDSKGKNANDVEMICKARQRYEAAARHVPGEFWSAVKRVCLENRDFEVSKQFSERRRMEIGFLLKCDLCRGLDRLIKFYWSL